MSSERFDVVIVGGAAIGSATAYFLTHDLGFDGSVAVVERDPTYAHAATTRSAASIRQQFSTPENIRMSAFGVAFFRDLKNRFGAEADIGFRERGYLFIQGQLSAQSTPTCAKCHPLTPISREQMNFLHHHNNVIR